MLSHCCTDFYKKTMNMKKKMQLRKDVFSNFLKGRPAKYLRCSTHTAMREYAQV